MAATVPELMELMAGELKLNANGREHDIKMRGDRRRQSPASLKIRCTFSNFRVRPHGRNASLATSLHRE
jgi:hypothetical protein